MKQKKYSSLLLVTISSASLLSACAGPETYQDKMSRYEAKTINKSQVPEIKTATIQFKSVEKIGRIPASAPETPNNTNAPKEINTTNKKLYFLELYSSYQSLKNYSLDFSAPTLSICPNFHTGMLQHNESYSNMIKSTSMKNKYSYDSTKFKDDSYIAARPELLLPLSETETTPKVVDVVKSSKEVMSEEMVSELVQKAIDIHLSKTYSELKELCEYGSSDNYYIYENLVTHIKNNKFEASERNMNVLLKTTIFSNMAIITSLDKTHQQKAGRSIASVVPANKKSGYATEVITRLNVSWANQYYNFIKESH